MECMRNCWFQNPDGDFDIEYASDSSVGLAATDNESPPKGIYHVPIYDSGNESGELSLLSIVNENTISTNQSHDIHICTQCSIHKRTIIELRTMLMEERRDDAILFKRLKKSIKNLVKKYQEKKKLLQQFVTSEANYTEKIENINNEMERLSNNNHEILKEKHDIEREKEALESNNLNLQLEINTHHQSLHQLKIKNNKMKTEMHLTQENNRKYSTKLLKELNNVKQEHMSFIYKMSNKSMANIHENNNNVWVNFDHSIARSRSHSDPEPDRSDGSDSDEAHIDNNNDDNNNNNNNNNNNPQPVTRRSISTKNAELPSIDEQKENIRFIRNKSISSDDTYDYEDDDELQFIMRSPSSQSLWQHKSFTNSFNANLSIHTPLNNKSVSFSQRSGLDTPISPLTTTTTPSGNQGHFRYYEDNNNNNNKKLGQIASGAIIYFDDDGIDVTDDNDESNDAKESNDNASKLHSFSDTEPIDLKTTQRVHEKLETVSLENTTLKSKNEKLRKEIKQLAKQLISIKNNI